MADLKALQDKVTELEQAASEREARDVAQDAVTAAQIAALQAIIDAGVPGGDQTAVDEMVAKLESVITSLKAADPTPPVEVPPLPEA